MNSRIQDPLVGFVIGFACFITASTPTHGATNSHVEFFTASELGKKVGGLYQGDGLCVLPTSEGAVLRCVFQKLDGWVTREGLWLTSTVESKTNDKFRILSSSFGREGTLQSLPIHGEVTAVDNLARLIRGSLIEEYSVSADGVRQDFILAQRPTGIGELYLELDVTGAQAELFADGVNLILDRSGRKLSYSRLHVVDAHGQELRARLVVKDLKRLVVLVDDAHAVYPVRIDPTFSDADWTSVPGANSVVQAAVFDGAGNLYIGGNFTVIGNTNANYIAKWNGSSWLALGSGMNNQVRSLAVLGNDVYAGGDFTTAGGTAAARIAKWNGNNWSPLDSGTSGSVFAIATSGSDLYVGGNFFIFPPGGGFCLHIAKWNGSSWSAVGSAAMNGPVYALAVSGSNLFAGGAFESIGSIGAHHIAKWNGSSWSALSTPGYFGTDGEVTALAGSGNDLYVGGDFTSAGGVYAGYIAKWNGTNWSALGLGVDNQVSSLAVSGSTVYVGGWFTKADSFAGIGGISANRIAKWDGSSWSPFGSGLNNQVNALALSASDLYVGGVFTTAGGKSSVCIARAKIASSSAPGIFGGLVYSPFAGFSYTFSGGSTGQNYRIQKAFSTAGPWTDLTNFVYTAPITITDASATTSTNKYYRAVSP